MARGDDRRVDGRLFLEGGRQGGRNVASETARRTSRAGRRSKDLEGHVAVEEEDDTVWKGAVASLARDSRSGCRAATPCGDGHRSGDRSGCRQDGPAQGRGRDRTAGAGHIPIGGAGLMVRSDPNSASIVEAAVTRAISRAVGEGKGTRADALKAAIADARARMRAAAQ